METSTLLRTRLANQQIEQSTFSNPHDLVRHLGAVQAQDFSSALWSIGLRLSSTTSTSAEVIRAIADKRLIWTWVMRGTLHIVAAEDARWMLRLLAHRGLSRAKSVYRQAGITDELYAAAHTILERALRGGGQLTRKEIMELWEKQNIPTSDQRGYLMLARLAQEAHICLGAPNEKAQTFVLLDEWLPQDKAMDQDKAVGKIMKRYFTGHGPATLDDFVWWTGLTRTDARRALDALLPQLKHLSFADKDYFYVPNGERLASPRLHLLPGFDEYMLGYTDRSLALRDVYRHHLYTKNAVYPGTVVIDGQIEGVWRRVIQKDTMTFTVSIFRTLTAQEERMIEAAALRYGEFWGKSVAVSYQKV